MNNIVNQPELQLAPCFKMTSTGLQITGAPTYEEWQAVGETLKFLESSIQFAIGDWLRYGESRWGEKYTQAIEETGYSEGTLRNYVSVANSVDLSLRSDKLPYSHHELVAPLRKEDKTPDTERQRYYLNLAIEQHLPVAKLREVIKQDERQRKLEARLVTVATLPTHIRIQQGDMVNVLSALANEGGTQFDLVIADRLYPEAKHHFVRFALPRREVTE